MTVTLTPEEAPERPAHRDGNVLRWLGAYTASTIGDSVYYMALAWAAARTGSAYQTGLVLAAKLHTQGPAAARRGVLADRFGPRRVVVVSDTARCLVILGLAGALLLTSPTVWMLIAVALVFGAADALFLPAVGALPPRITAASTSSPVSRGCAASPPAPPTSREPRSAASPSPSAARSSRSPRPVCSSPSRCRCCFPYG